MKTSCLLSISRALLYLVFCAHAEECHFASCDYEHFPEPTETPRQLRSKPGIISETGKALTKRRLNDNFVDFEGLANFAEIGDSYADKGLYFSSNAWALIDSDWEDGAGSGNIGGLPSPHTVMFFVRGSNIIMNIPAGCELGISFWYSAPFEPGYISVYDGTDGNGNLLATQNLPLTPESGSPDPTGVYSPLLCDRVPFSGIACSVVFGGGQNNIVFDDIKCGEDAMPPGWGD